MRKQMRPIAVVGHSLAPVQLGVGTSGGYEAAIHATRRFLATCRSIMYNEVGLLQRFQQHPKDAVLMVIADQLLENYRFCHLAYQITSLLK